MWDTKLQSSGGQDQSRQVTVYPEWEGRRRGRADVWEAAGETVRKLAKWLLMCKQDITPLSCWDVYLSPKSPPLGPDPHILHR